MNNYELLIENKGVLIFPFVEGAVTFTTKRQLGPGVLDFSIVNSPDLEIEEGNAVRFKVNGTPVFYGFIFKISGDNDILKVVAYDQIRYLKNKDTMQYENMTASSLLKRIAGEFNLKCGDVEDTKYILPPRNEINQTLIDIIKTALESTLQNTNKLYVLYDDFGNLVIKDLEKMRLNLFYDGLSMGDFSFESSIDNNTYNKIKLVRGNEKTGKYDVYVSKDSSNINKWGILQYTEELKEGENGESKVESLLKLLNKRTRTYKANNVLGNLSVRGGVSFAVQTRVGSEVKCNYMIVDSVKHKFEDNEHFMDLDLVGGA